MAMTTTGLSTLRYADIISNVKQNLYTNLSPNIDLSEDSAIGLLLSSVCLQIADLYEVTSEVYDSGIITKAEGTSLDELCLWNGIYRTLAKSTTGFVEITGDVGTVLSTTSNLISTAGDIFNSRDSVTLTPIQCVGARMYVNSVKAGETYTVIIDNVIFSYTAQEFDFDFDILNALAASINGGLEMVATVDMTTDPQKPALQIDRDKGSISKRTQVAAVTGTTYLTFTKVTALVTCDSQDAGAIVADAGVINDMQTSVAGIDTVYNRWDMTTGRDEETDTELRERYLDNLVVTGIATLDSILQAVKRVSGVQNALITENDTEEVNSQGIPAKSFMVTVVGGTVNDIAQAIWDTKPVGIRSYGSTKGVATDVSDNSHDVYFFRPTEKFVWFKISYTIDDEETLNYDQSDLDEEIKKAINNYGATMDVGTDIIPNRVLRYIYEHITGIVVDSFSAAISGNQSDAPEDSEYQTSKISISDDEYTVWETNQYTISVTS